MPSPASTPERPTCGNTRRKPRLEVKEVRNLTLVERAELFPTLAQESAPWTAAVEEGGVPPGAESALVSLQSDGTQSNSVGRSKRSPTQKTTTITGSSKNRTGEGLMYCARNAAALRTRRLYSAPPSPVMIPSTTVGKNMPVTSKDTQEKLLIGQISKCNLGA